MMARKLYKGNCPWCGGPLEKVEESGHLYCPDCDTSIADYYEPPQPKKAEEVTPKEGEK